ncbi:MAG: MiaB/RimO family radical SAM methylthiotransferase [Alphaproteobacteria bacterium]|nr:MiaB/RimO family radical SAM methylthiotransferase [Alphaproteobacteria bacterium]
MKNIRSVPFGCRLNILEGDKIAGLLADSGIQRGIVVNTCAVTSEAEKQSRQAVRRLARENPDMPIYVTGCAATHSPSDFEKIPGVAATIHNKDKLDATKYVGARTRALGRKYAPLQHSSLSKGLVQIQNGCNHACSYCITRILRGKNVSFPYEQILAATRALTANGYGEIVLTGVDIASYQNIAILCKNLLFNDANLQRLRLSSLDPGVPLRSIVDLMHENPRMLSHMHLSMQSGCNEILAKMGRRHTTQMVRELSNYANGVTFSWDLICGFPGETEEHFNETCDLIRELKPIRLHAFPFSPRPGTPAASMPGQVHRTESKRRVKIATEIAAANMREFMNSQIGRTAQILVESNNIGRTPDDIPVKISGCPIPERTIMNVKLTGIKSAKELYFTGTPI